MKVSCLLGEGIHHAMEAGKMAAGFVGECLDCGNFDAEVMSIWHDVWMDKFGSDYRWSVLCRDDNCCVTTVNAAASDLR